MNEQDQYISIPSKNNIEGYCEIIISFLQHVILDRQYRDRCLGQRFYGGRTKRLKNPLQSILGGV